MNNEFNWHERFLQQAGWTKSLRDYIFAKALPPTASKILEIGCGTGAILSDLTGLSSGGNCTLYGIDLEEDYLAQARQHAPPARLACANAYDLPFPNYKFDATYCHYVLLWLNDPAGALREMRRVTAPGGAILGLAEPDYGGRIDYPEALARLGTWQSQSLQAQGANPKIGRRLAGLFKQAGLVEVESGVLGAQWSQSPTEEDSRMEWQVMRNDLAEAVPKEALDVLERIDQQASQAGERVLFVPTFYAWGRVPET
jgi:ubiquinone/menaquinone biosynthesis C-methylase UbiE